MSYARFKFAEIARAPAAVAAVAAVASPHHPAPSAANAASAAAPQEKSEISVGSAERSAPPAISPYELQVSFHLIVDRLVDRGCSTEAARADATAILTAMVGNDPRIVPPQPDAWRCVACNERGSPGAPLVPVLTPIEGENRWLHLGCHDDYRRRQDEAVEEVMRSAGLLFNRKDIP